MSQLDFFRKFVANSEPEVNHNHEVWSYSRVSSKEQFEQNSSVLRQIEANKQCAVDRNFSIVEEFGGTYESAKSDFTRKEFTRLIDKVKKSRKKPYAILVFKMSRFSRSGGNAIGLVSYLVDELKVHLIEVSSGLDTTTERGKAAIWESLFHAFKENLERKEIIVPNMIAFVKAGNWFSKAPEGWDHYGPRVSNERFLSKKQRIILNDNGRILREAWQWKISGMFSDAQIHQKLQTRGIKMTKQKISAMWKNPFYCGINTNKLAGEPVLGNWEPMVSVDDFMKVQRLLEKNPSGYQHKKEVDDRPLTRLLRCNICNCYMVGYKNNKKGLHYYRCLKCNGVSLSAKTIPRGIKKSAEKLFVELLEQFQINPELTPLIELQLTKLFKHYNKYSYSEQKKWEHELNKTEQQIKKLKIRLGLSEIDKETYDLTLEHLSNQLLAIGKELNNGKLTISNLDELLRKSLERLENLSEMWVSSDLQEKRRMHKTMFPEGIFYDPIKHQYLTRQINSYVELVASISTDYEAKKNRTLQTNVKESCPVSGSRLELPSAAADMNQLLECFMVLINSRPTPDFNHFS